MTEVMASFSSDRLPSLALQVVPGKANIPRGFSIGMDKPPSESAGESAGESANLELRTSSATGKPGFSVVSSASEEDLASTSTSFVI